MRKGLSKNSTKITWQIFTKNKTNERTMTSQKQTEFYEKTMDKYNELGNISKTEYFILGMVAMVGIAGFIALIIIIKNMVFG